MKILIGVIDNGMGLSRTSWAVCLANACLGVLREHEVTFAEISYPYCAGALNKVCNVLMESECDELLIIDTDLIFSPQHIKWLLSHEEPLVFGLYPKKQPGLTYPTVALESNPDPFGGDSVLCEVERTARGFMRLHRSVLETIQPHVETYIDAQTGKHCFEYWRTLPGDHSEDFAFCDLWRSLGGKILIDKRCTAQHEGSVIYPIPGTF